MGGGSAGSVRYTDVWYSSDGLQWTRATANAGWLGRYKHTVAVYDSRCVPAPRHS